MASSRAMGDYLTTHTAPAPVEAPVTWSDCPTCWAQAVIWYPTAAGYIPTVCPGCLGVGQTAQVTS